MLRNWLDGMASVVVTRKLMKRRGIPSVDGMMQVTSCDDLDSASDCASGLL